MYWGSIALVELDVNAFVAPIFVLHPKVLPKYNDGVSESVLNTLPYEVLLYTISDTINSAVHDPFELSAVHGISIYASLCNANPFPVNSAVPPFEVLIVALYLSPPVPLLTRVPSVTSLRKS